MQPLVLLRTLLAAFAVVIAVVVAGIVIVNQRLVDLFASANADAAHDLAVDRASAEVMQEVLDLQSGVRGFLLTGDPEFLEPYERARDALPATLGELSLLLAEDAASSEDTTRIAALVATWQREVANPHLAHMRVTGEVDHARLVVGSEMIDGVRAELTQLGRHAANLRVERRARLDARRAEVRRQLYYAAGGASVLALVLGLLIATQLTRSVAGLVRSSERLAAGAFDAPIDGARWELDRIARALRDAAAVLARREREADTLIELGPRLWRAPSWDDALGELVTAISPIAPVTVASISVIEDGQVERIGVAPPGPLPSGPASRRAIEPTSVFAEAVRTRAPVHVTDMSSDRYADNVRARSIGVTSYLAIPLTSHERTYGTVNFAVASGPAYGQHEVRFLTMIGRLIGDQVANRRLAAELEQRNGDLQRASEAKSAFLAMMSHELRTPLNSIIGFSEVLIDGKFGAVNERQTRYLRNVNDSGNHLLRLINDLLDLSKIEAGRLEIMLQACAVAPQVAEALATLRPLADARGVTLEVVTAAGTPHVSADPVRLKQILYNLLSNAIKFTPSGGRITASCTPSPVGGMVRIAVRDEGPGIAADDLATLFTAFTQLRSGSEQGGTGLGLSLTKQLVELMHGQVGAHSIVGQGSTFFVDLPAAEREPVGAAVSEALATRPLALVVDDDPAAAELLVLALEADGFRTMSAATGERALALAREHAPQVITLDVFLPTIDGWDLLRILRSDPATARIPVVVVTISSDRERAFSLGAIDHLVKPIAKGQLRTTLLRHGLAATTIRPIHVLVIDDDEHQCELARAELEPHGFAVRTAQTGGAGIAAASETPLDVILLDLVLPDLSGVEVVDALRGNPATRAIPVLMITAHDLTADQRARIEGGVEAVLGKRQLDAAGLVAEIRRVAEPLG